MTVVSQHVQNLTAGTVYHYRVVASSEIEHGKTEMFDGPEESFTTQGGGGGGLGANQFSLIDGRGWEMVSPPAKEGALVIWPGEAGMFQAAAAGGAFAYLTNVPTEAGVPGYSNEQQLLSTRGAGVDGSWGTHDLAQPHNGSVGQSDNAGQEYRFFNEQLTTGIVQPYGAFQPCHNSENALQPCLSEAASEQTAFSRDLETGTYTPLVTGCPAEGDPCAPAVREHANVPDGTVFGQQGSGSGEPCPPEKFCGPFFLGASPNGEHVIVRAKGIQLPGTTAPAETGLYEWSAANPRTGSCSS